MPEPRDVTIREARWDDGEGDEAFYAVRMTQREAEAFYAHERNGAIPTRASIVLGIPSDRLRAIIGAVGDASADDVRAGLAALRIARTLGHVSIEGRNPDHDFAAHVGPFGAQGRDDYINGAYERTPTAAVLALAAVIAETRHA